ncbi:NAD-dependent epimerase/dehydratase family protein [[Clostridium] leptum]|uniref:NAD-dependent epimerase/dehydratase family protein n=1 Tax=[Clostridium] leptum TaxID=1535 RepID=A0A412AXE0_9FIRM|nr:NAD-dependent epimerase/dehydratase family protein [[Clostridium] leptum]
MFDKYLVTGATGFLGRAVVKELVRRKAQVHALVLHNDPYIDLLPKEFTPSSAMCAIKARL